LRKTESGLVVPTTEELRSIMTAYGRQQAAFADETARFFMDVDLTMAQFRALATIRRWGRLTGRDLAHRLHVTPGTLVPLVDRLEELGYLRRVPDLDDRRLTWLELTPKTARLFQRLWSMGAGRIAAAIGQLIPRDRAELKRILNQVADRLESQATGRLEKTASA
jgi:DNA-binding MarR family transcriptional regulator